MSRNTPAKDGLTSWDGERKGKDDAGFRAASFLGGGEEGLQVLRNEQRRLNTWVNRQQIQKK